MTLFTASLLLNVALRSPHPRCPARQRAERKRGHVHTRRAAHGTTLWDPPYSERG